MDQSYLSTEELRDAATPSVPKPQILTPKQKYAQLLNLQACIKYRMEKQKRLINKIQIGKWKSSTVGPKLMTALAKHDLKLLRRSSKELEKLVPEAKELADEEQ